MINTALQASTAADGRPSSDPAANVTSTVRESVYQVSGVSSVSVNKIKRRELSKRASKRLLGLRAIGNARAVTSFLAHRRHFLVSRRLAGSRNKLYLRD